MVMIRSRRPGQGRISALAAAAMALSRITLETALHEHRPDADGRQIEARRQSLGTLGSSCLMPE
jgi:hypothetical protein